MWRLRFALVFALNLAALIITDLLLSLIKLSHDLLRQLKIGGQLDEIIAQLSCERPHNDQIDKGIKRVERVRGRSFANCV